MDKTKLKGVAALIAAAVAVILAAFLCMSFPMAEVHAAEYDVSDGPSLVCRMAEAQEGDIIRLQDSITIDLTDEATVQSMYGGRVEANKDLYLSADTTYPAHSQTLDLNGKTLTIITGSDKSCFTLEGDITLTIIDSSAERTGAIVGHSNGSLFYSKTAESSLVLQDVAVKFTEYTEGGASITPTSAVIDTVGNVTLNNVTYTPAEGGPALIGDNAGAQVSYIADTAEELAAAVADSSYSTVMLGADITQNITVEAGRTLTLDLNGHTLTAAAVDEKAVVSNYGTLTIVNTDTANTGAIQSTDGSTWYTVFNEGTMTIGAEGEGYGELEVKNNSASSPASLVENNHDCSAEDPATLTIVSGTFTASGACLNAVKNDGYGICTIYGGTFRNEAEGGAAVMSAGTMTIYDGTFVQESDAAISNVVRNTGVGSPVAIKGGSFTGELYNEGADGFAISGGTFDRTFSMTYLTDAVSVWFKDGDSAFIVAEEQPAGTTQAVAYIRGGVFYATLQDAINDVSDSFTKEISLAADAKESVIVPAGVEFDFRMSGYSLTSANDSAPAMTVNGSVTWINEVTGTISGKSGVLVKEGGVAYIKQSTTITFTGETNLSVEAGGKATVENGIFNGAIVNNGGTIELSGGTYAQKPAEEWLASGYGVVEQGGEYTVGLLYAEIAYMQGGQQVTEDFTDWAAAMKKLAELEGTITVKLYRQIGIGSAEFVVNEGQTVTLDQNGKSFSANIKNNGTLTITGSTGRVPAEAAEKLVNNGTLKIEGGKFNITSLENTGDLTIYGGSFGKSRELIVSMFAYFAEGVVVSAASDGYVTVKEAAAEAEVVCGDDVAIPCGSLSVAQSYSRYFAGDDTVTISLLTDASIKYLTFMGSAAPWTIDLNGRTLTVTSEYGLTFGSYSMSNRSFTVMGGTILLTTGASDKYAINVKYGATLALDDVNVEFAGTTPFADMINVADNGTLNIESGNYYGGITRTNGTITIAEGCVFEEDIKDILGDGLTQNESGMVVKDGAENAVAMIETETGFAYYDTLQAAIDEASDGATVTLLKDLTESVSIAEGQEIVLDLGGKTLSSEGRTITNCGTLTVKNGTVVGGTEGRTAIFNGLEDSGEDVTTELYNVALTLENVNISSNKTVNGVALTNNYAKIFSITGGTITAQPGMTAISNSGWIGSITGTTIKVEDDDGLFTSLGKAIVLGGDVNCADSGVIEKVSGCTITGVINVAANGDSQTGSITMTDSTFDGSFDCGDGFYALATENGYTAGGESFVIEADALAAIGSSAYTSLREAFAEAKSGDTVTLLADTKLEGDRIEIGSASEESAAAFEITFDLNGYTLKIGLVAADISAEEPNYNTAALFVGYNATLNLIDSSKEGTGTIDAQEASDLTVPVAAMRAGAVLNISGGTIIVDTAYESCVYAGGGGVVVINGGTFINQCEDPFIHVSDGSSPALAVNISDSYTDGGTYLTINGGTFVGRNPMLGDTNPAVTSSYMGSDVNIAQLSDGSFAAVGADEPLPEGAAYLYTVENGEVVVTVYTEEALSAAVAGDETFADNTYATVRLGTDITQSIVIEGGRDLTLDLNGKTLTNTAGDHTITNYGTLTIIDSGENGTVTNTTTSRAAVKNEGTTYLNGGTYTRTADGTWYVIVNNGVMELRDITVTNLNVNDPSSLVQNNLDMDSANPAQLTIYSGVYDCAGGNTIMNNDYGVLTIEDGTFGASNFTDVYNYQAVQNYGTLVINGGTFTANSVAVSASSYGVLETSTTINGGTFRAGSDGSAAALYIYDHDGTGFINVTINGGEFSGVYAIRSFRTDTTGESLSVAGGTFEGEIAVGGLVGFITGGSFKQQPAEELFDENYAAEYQNGYYVAVRSDALKTARANAQADVRNYAAANGISWLALEDEAATVGTETPVYTAQQAADILAAFNAIDSAMTQLAVAEARLAAMNMVDAYVEALDTYKLDMIGDLQTAAADDEETVDVDESVVLPTATYSAIYNATSASEIDFYVANALAEIEAIRSLRTEISGQTQQLADLADALTAMSEGLFGTEGEDGTLTGGAFADLLDKVQDAIAGAQDAIVNGTTGEDGATTSISLASIRKYLEGTIKTTLDSISANLTALTDKDGVLTQIKNAIDTFDVSKELEDEFGNVLTAITNAQDAITGSTEGEGGKSITDAIKEINEATESAVKGLRDELVGEDGTSGVLGTIAGYVDSLESMLGDENSGLAAIVANIKAAQAAIMGVTEEDADGVSLSEVLKAVNTADGVIDQVLAAVQGLTGKDGILTQIKSAVDGLTELNIGGKFNDVLDAITDAQEAIMGTTEESAGTSIAGAVTAITGVVNALTKEDGMVYAINETLNALREALTGTESNAFTKLAEQLKLAIIGTGDATLTSIASGVAGANEVIANVLAAVQALTDADDGIVAQVETELAEMLKKIETLTGALATSEQVKGIETGIADAKTEIDKIVAAIGSLGTGEGNDLATQIGGIVSDIEAVQGAVDEIGSNLGVAVDIEETKTNAVADLEVWLNAYLDTLLGTTTDEAESGVVMLAVTLETEDGDLYGRLTQAYSEANAQLILKYYNQALTAIDNATSTTDVSTAVSTFRAQVLLYDDLAAAQNTPSMTGVYVLLAIVLVVLIAASIVVILKNRKAAAVAAEPAAEAAAEEKPAEEAKPEAAEEAAEEGSEMEESAEAEKPEAEEELAADDDDKEQVVIAANVRSFAEAYVELSDEQRELFNKVKEYALGKEGTSEVKLSSGVCVKLGSKQVVKLAVRRGNPVALFVLENEMLKDFRRGATTQAKLKVRATELVLREEADLETAYTMVDLSIDQIKKDAEAAKERRREQRRERRKQRLAEEAARQAEHDGSED